MKGRSRQDLANREERSAAESLSGNKTAEGSPGVP